ncbi:hypothetical protein DH2020_045333 [Rehmannia glutinosa]|uniref:BURP domain-containing protein n=1 Tax=Rehmannia glutinosa TaxID=99300 RepID=A0ABR0UEG5_REHGL
MGSKISPLIVLLYSVFFLQCFPTTEGHIKHGKNWNSNHLRLPANQDNTNSDKKLDDDHISLISEKNPELSVFFYYNTLKVGKKLPIYFPTKDPSTSPHLLSRQESDSIPFSTSQFPYILKFFSFSKTSKQAIAMRKTLHHCEFPAIKGETKFCATSLESMLDSVRGIFGSTKFRLFNTNYLSESMLSPLQNYTVIETPNEILARKIVACHMLPYPYAVFYCHSQESDNKLYKVLLEGEDGGGVEAAAICHMDTSQWDPHHVAFRIMKTVPGASPVCHFFPADNLVWIPLS